MDTIKLYGTKTCPQCMMLKTLLEEKGIEYENKDVMDIELAKEVHAITKKLSIPVIVKGDKFLVKPSEAEVIEFIASA